VNGAEWVKASEPGMRKMIEAEMAVWASMPRLTRWGQFKQDVRSWWSWKMWNLKRWWGR